MKKTPFIIIIILMLCGCDDFFEKDIRESGIDVVFPGNDVSLEEGTITFLWELLEGADSYRLMLVSPSFRNAERMLTDTLIMPDSVSWNIRYECPLTEGSYQWSVQAINSAYSSVRHIYSLTVNAKPDDDEEDDDDAGKV